MTELTMIRMVLRIAIISAIVLIVGCSNQNLVTESGSPKEPLGETYGFTSFDVAIDTKEIKGAVLANYNEKRDKTRSDIRKPNGRPLFAW